MDLVQAAVIGLVQGLTEFLPVSSTGHIRIVPALLGWPDPGAAFTATIQLGTTFAVVIYFWGDLVRILKAFLSGLRGREGRELPEWRQGLGIAIGTLPIVAIGFAAKGAIETSLRSLYVIAWGLIVMGVVLAVAERFGAKSREMSSATWRDGLWVGMWQAIALIPGCSRSGSTLAGAYLAGFDRASAARYSFLLSLPAIVAAALFSLKGHSSELLSPEVLPPLLVANLVAGISGYASIGLLLKILGTRGTWPFVVYRVALGVLILGLLAAGRLDPMQGMGTR